jgi:DNA-binding NarL/FixJ family response regulator
MTLRCLIVDDSEPVLRAAGDLLQAEGLTIAGVATNGADAVRLVQELEPDVVLVDIALGAESGFDVIRRLVRSLEETGSRAILISTHDEVDFEDLIAESAAIGFVPKSDLSAAAIVRVLEEHGGEGR